MESEAFGSPQHCNAKILTTIVTQQRIPSLVYENLFYEEIKLPFSGMAQCRSKVVQLLGDECDFVEEGLM